MTVQCVHMFLVQHRQPAVQIVLHRTAVENEAIFGEAAASVFHHICFDDLEVYRRLLLTSRWKPPACASLVASILPNSSPIIRHCGCQQQNIIEKWE